MISPSGVTNCSMMISWSVMTQVSVMITKSGAPLFSMRIPCVSRQSVFNDDFSFKSDRLFLDDFLVSSDSVFGDDYRVRSNFDFYRDSMCLSSVSFQ